MIINLTPFYNPHDDRDWTTEPFSDSANTYATDGYILIRVPRRSKIVGSAFAAKTSKQVLSEFATGKRRKWFGIPALPKAIMEKCLFCENDENDRSSCRECSGTGCNEKVVSVDISTRFYQRKYLAMLAKLPDCKISPNALYPAWFKFDGGDGLLMPMQWRQL